MHSIWSSAGATLTSVEETAQQLCPLVPISEPRLVGSVHCTEPHGIERDDVTQEIGKDMERIGDEGERSRLDTDGDLDDEKRGSDGDDSKNAMLLVDFVGEVAD